MLTVTDSIGIKLLADDCLLTGVGNELHQYYLDSTNRTVHTSICLNFRSKIYGFTSFDKHIESHPQFVVVYAGREVAILLNQNKDLKLVTRLELNDWISSVHVYEPTSNDSVSFCIVSAHSVASEFKVYSSGKWSIEHKSSCLDKCTLYSSLIIGSKWHETTIFGGTAFGELIIWRVNEEGSPCEVLQRVSGHNGVIFSINCSIRNNLITTTSDDRSVKIWNLTFATDKSIDAAADWNNCTIEPSKSMFGHTARIFNHKIIEYNNKVYIITVGEDGNVCTWCENGRLVNRKPIAPGVSLWNLEYDSNRHYLFACGNDGNVYQLNLRNILNETQFSCKNFEVKGFEEGEYVEKMAIMQSHAIVIMLTYNRKLFYGEIKADVAECKWHPLPEAETGYKITVLETHGSLVITAGYQYLTIYQLKNGQFSRVFHGKPPSVDSSPLLRSLKFITEKEFVICDSRGNGSIITIDENFNITKDQRFQMPPCKERWMTIADRFQNNLVVGDRHGNMHLYEINDTLNLKHTLWRAYGNLGCKTIFRTSNEFQFESAGHQGKMKTIVINDSNQELELRSTHDIPIKWCEKAVEIDEHHNILLAGFNERHFVAWRIDNSYRFEFDCGGGHRAWDIYIDKQTSKAHLFFVRSKLLNCVQFDLHDNALHPFNISRNDWHSRPCNTMCIIELSNHRFLIASGGDDNLLKFSKINMPNSSDSPADQTILQHDFDMVLHISNIRSIFSLRMNRAPNHGDDCENWLIFSCGGRAQICVTEVKIDQQQNVQFHEVCDFMLRSSDFQRKRTKQTQIIYFDPETRFMSLVAYHHLNQINIVVGCSDGYIRSFTFANGSISFDNSLFYGRCILNVYHFKYDGNNYLITMATNGLLVFWSLDTLNEQSKPLFKLPHHDSGINSFDIFIDDSKMFIATGGDDQTIVISVVDLNASDAGIEITVLKTEKFPFNHTAQVNGIKFSADKKSIYSASVDQTVLRVDLTDFTIEQTAYSCISDVKGLQVINSNHLLVYGCGMQILNV